MVELPASGASLALASPGKKRAGKILERAWADWCRAVEALRREEAAAEALWEEQREKFASDPVGAALGNVEGAIGNVFGAIEIPPFTSLWDNDKRGPESRHNTPPPFLMFLRISAKKRGQGNNNLGVHRRLQGSSPICGKRK